MWPWDIASPFDVEGWFGSSSRDPFEEQQVVVAPVPLECHPLAAKGYASPLGSDILSDKFSDERADDGLAARYVVSTDRTRRNASQILPAARADLIGVAASPAHRRSSISGMSSSRWNVL